MANHRDPAHRTLHRYLERRTCCQDWPLQGARPEACASVVAIPSLGEYPGILDTLGDLAACRGADETFVIVVVNNRVPEDASAGDIDANLQTLEALRTWDQNRLRLGWIDASSPGRELPEGEGVGLARKLGLDWGLQLLADQQSPERPLICLDGDTRVDAGYLAALHGHFEGSSRWAAVLPYAHPIEGDERQRAAILCYEFFLRYHAGQMTWAGSPYGYHAIGSAMACTGLAYAAITGMNRRQAGEDFYFLQQLAKTGPVETVAGTVVRPSGRPSHRVPFGTGRRVMRFLDGDGEDEYRLYHPDSYRVIRQWLAAVAAHPDDRGERLLSQARTMHSELHAFLAGQGFERSWDRLVEQASSPEALADQFRRWFDGFRTLKCIHHLRDSSWPDAPMFEAIGALLERLGKTPGTPLDNGLVADLPRQEVLLEQLRHLED